MARSRGCARVHYRTSGQHGSARHACSARRHGGGGLDDHASILDGCVLSRAKVRAFRHNRLDLLEKRLRSASEDGGGVLVVVDGVFSMEGDVAPLGEIVDLADRYGARVMVDEAHALGVLGARGAGTCELMGVEESSRSADGHVLQVAGLLRRPDRRAGRRD